MLKIETKNKLLTKEFLTTTTVILFCLGLFIYFPTRNSIQEITKNIFFLLLIPLLYIKFILKEDVNEWGLNIQNKKEGFVWAILMLILSLVIAYIFIRYTSFAVHYPLSSLIINNFWGFLIYILVFLNLSLFLQEYFFHGFILTNFARKLSYKSILVQAGLYLIIILLMPGNFHQLLWQSIPFIIVIFTGGVTAYKSKSIIYSYFSGLLFFLIVTSYLVYLIKIS